MIIGTDALDEPGTYTAHCWFDGQPGVLERFDHESATAYVLPVQAAATGEPVAVPGSRIEQVIVRDRPEPATERACFPAPAALGESVLPALLGDPLQALTDAVCRAAPEGWQEATIDARALGTWVDLRATVTSGDTTAFWIPPREIAEWLRRLREYTYTPTDGTWTLMGYRLAQGAQPMVEYGYSEPASWFADDAETNAQACYDELRYLPRAHGVDQWLLEPAWQHHMRERPKHNAEPQPMRMARVFDARSDGTPEVYRPVLSRFEAEDVVRYLLAGYPVLEARSQSVDEVDPERGAQVPKAYLTDGVWVWPVAVAYYLGEHGLTPQRDLLAHIRGRGYQAPEEVADFAVEQAKAMVLGTDVESLTASTRDGILGELRTIIASHGISRRFYSLNGPLAGGWSMLLAGDGWWEVAFHPAADDAAPAMQRFAGLIDAATYLLGSLLRNQPDYQRQPGEPLEDFECPWGVMHDELQLAALDGKHMDDLAEGAEIDRFGTDGGNLAFLAGATLPQRGVAQNEEQGQYRRYRVRAPFGVVIGTVRGDPEGNTVGGGTAYVLPQSLGELVTGGWVTGL